MLRVLLLLLMFALCSCEYFSAKKTTSDAIYKEELKTFNWNDVDEFPTFSVCDSLETKTDKQECFQTTITNHISKNLEKEIIVVSQDISDTLIMELQISEKGDITVLDIEAKETTLAEIPDIESLLKNALLELPQVFPAIKRGQQVKTQFKLPIILQAVN